MSGTGANQDFPIDLQTSWADFSPALHWYTAEKVKSVLESFASRIDSVTVRISTPPGEDPTAAHCAIEVVTRDAGAVSTTASGNDLYEIVDRAAEYAGESLRA